MQTVPHERLALVQAEMVVLFFENKWNNHRFFTKCAILLHWWPEVVATVGKAPAPSFWRIPSNLDPKGKLAHISHEDEAKLRIEKQIAAKTVTSSERTLRKRPVESRQENLALTGGSHKKNDVEK